MKLIEREAALAVLDERLAAARPGEGSVVLVHGGAGIGKTTLLRTWVGTLLPAVPLAWGTCDPLTTPSPLDLSQPTSPNCGRRRNGRFEDLTGPMRRRPAYSVAGGARRAFPCRSRHPGAATPAIRVRHCRTPGWTARGHRCCLPPHRWHREAMCQTSRSCIRRVRQPPSSWLSVSTGMPVKPPWSPTGRSPSARGQRRPL